VHSRLCDSRMVHGDCMGAGEEYVVLNALTYSAKAGQVEVEVQGG